MSTAGGPKLYGIGRGGDSDIVLCMDAHDAGSYPGEPATNFITENGVDFSVRSGYTDLVTNQVADGESPSGYACEMYVTNVSLNSSARSKFGDQTDPPMPNSGTAFVQIWAKYVGSITGWIRPAVFAGNSWHSLYGLEDGTMTGGSGDPQNILTSEYRLFGGVITLGTGSGGPNPAFSMTRDGTKSLTNIVRWHSPQLTTTPATYSAPFVRAGKGIRQGFYSSRPASVNLMIHGNVGSGSSFEDSSPSKHTVTASNHGSAADPVHSGVSKFSGGSIYFDGSTYSGAGSYLSVPDSTDWNFGTGDFTVDFWIRLNNLGTSSGGGDYRPHQEAIGNYDSTSGFRIGFVHKSTSEDGIWLYGPGVSLKAGNITGWVVDTWYHIAVVRYSGYASIYKDGVLRAGPTSWTSDVGDSSHPLIMGMDPRANPPTGYPLDGYLDEIRVTKGTALWVSAFNDNPPTRRNLSAPVVDLSGSDNDGNFATTAMTDDDTYRVGEVIEPVASAVWDFDGTDDCIKGGKGCRVGNTRRKTIEAWVRGVTTGTRTLFFMGDHGNNYKWQWTTIGGGQYMTGSGYGTRYYWSAAQLIAAGWHHWVDVVDEDQGAGDRVRRYVDGVLLTPNALTTDTGDSFYDGTDMYVDIGMADLGSGPYGLFDGEIGAIRLYKNALTWAQVKENFNQQRSRFKI